jgi:hypothetical protein
VSEGRWVISELDRDARGGPGEVFEWTADSKASGKGGARAAPIGTWKFGVQQRHVRTDYPGATTPSYQILGPSMKSFTLEGVFDDRYNFPGYAVAEMRRLEDMIRRGSFCRLQFQDQVFIGLFTDCDFPYKRDWQIGYALTFDVSERPEVSAERVRVADDLSPGALLDAADLHVQLALEFNDTAPRSLLTGSTMFEVESSLTSMTSATDELALAFDNRDLATPDSPVDGFTRLATKFRTLQGTAYELTLTLGAVRSDTELGVQTAMAVLDFEDWTRSLRFAARLAMGSAAAGDRACGARAEPDAVRLYRPQEGESLYAISRKFYSTPWAWRLIYDRNALSSVTLTGDEVLIIPERG